jgi:hypothetical protein
MARRYHRPPSPDQANGATAAAWHTHDDPAGGPPANDSDTWTHMSPNGHHGGCWAALQLMTEQASRTGA